MNTKFISERFCCLNWPFLKTTCKWAEIHLLAKWCPYSMSIFLLHAIVLQSLAICFTLPVSVVPIPQLFIHPNSCGFPIPCHIIWIDILHVLFLFQVMCTHNLSLLSNLWRRSILNAYCKDLSCISLEPNQRFPYLSTAKQSYWMVIIGSCQKSIFNSGIGAKYLDSALYHFHYLVKYKWHTEPATKCQKLVNMLL